MSDRARRFTVLAVAAGTLLACTAATLSVTVAVAAQPLPAPPPGGVVMASQPQVLPTSSRHSAFPGLAKAPDGSLTLVFRGGYDHANTRDGSIYRARGTITDQGLIWSAPTQVPLPAGHDYRDPSISYVAGHEYLTYFTGANGTPEDGAQGAYVVRDGGPPVRIDPNFPRAAISAPVVQLPDGRLGAAFYGWKAGESTDTAWMAWSSDLGQSWSVNRILNDGLSHAEPVLLVRNGMTHLIARGGSDTLVMRSSTASGASGSWDAPHVIVGACTGRPSAMVTQAGTMVMVCRGILPAVNAQVAYSVDGTGQKWWWGPTLVRALAGSFGMTYAAMVEILPGVILTVGGMENPDGSSYLYTNIEAESRGSA